ncbi:MAG: regulatory protein GemA [Alphaproteobacteria bacterium]|nr:regulatory protein GemA [Alphaproteobacteria bacterium]
MKKVISFKARSGGKTFDARRGLIAKVHVAKKQLAMEDESYRSLLRRITGKDSAADLTKGQLESVLREFERLGFSGTVRRTKPGGLPSEPQAKLIRALWFNLYHLGELDNPAEDALVAYCHRMSGVARIEWMHSEQFDNVIRGLRGWLQRIGWENPTSEDIRALTILRLQHGVQDSPTDYSSLAAKVATIRAQCNRIDQPMDKLMDLWSAEELDEIIRILGQTCRSVKAQQRESK